MVREQLTVPLSLLQNQVKNKVEKVQRSPIVKFILNLGDGRRIVTFFNNVCDESRGEPGDCRVGVRFKNQ